MPRLTEKKIEQLKSDYKKGIKVDTLMKRYDISRATFFKYVGDVKNRQNRNQTEESSESSSSSDSSSSSESESESASESVSSSSSESGSESSQGEEEEEESSASPRSTREKPPDVPKPILKKKPKQQEIPHSTDEQKQEQDPDFHDLVFNEQPESQNKVIELENDTPYPSVPQRKVVFDQDDLVDDLLDTQQPKVPKEVPLDPLKQPGMMKSIKKEKPSEMEAKRRKMQEIRNYVETFRENIQHIVGFTPKENEDYFNRIRDYDHRRLQIELDEIRFAISNKNSLNLFKHMYFTGIGAVEALGTNLLDMKIQGLTQELARNKEIDMILKELGCIHGISTWTDPRLKLLAMTGFNILALDSRNRTIEYMKEVQKPQNSPPPVKKEPIDLDDLDDSHEWSEGNPTTFPPSKPTNPTNSKWSEGNPTTLPPSLDSDQNKQLLRQLNNFNLE